MPKKRKEISLLPEEKGGLKNNLNKIADWLVNTGRWIIVFTQLFVIIAFLSRFWLDQEIADLYAKTSQKIAIIEAAQEFEEEFRILQGRLIKIGQVNENRQNVNEKIEKIIALLPPQISLRSIEVHNEEISFLIVSRNEQALINFFKNLIVAPYLKQINVDSISTKTFGLETELLIKVILDGK